MHILLEPRNKNIMPLLSKPTRDALNSNFRLAKSEYFNSNFMPLLGVLADEPSGSKSGGKAATKEKFTKFFDLLEEVAERHRIARVLEDDEEGKETVADEVVRLVVPSLRRRIRRRSLVRVGTCFRHFMYYFVDVFISFSPMQTRRNVSVFRQVVRWAFNQS